VIHAALLGSVDRFMGIIIEHFAGAFPLWLAPIQATVLPVSDKFSTYGEAVHKELLAAGIRSSWSDPNESLGKRIRAAEMMKIPYVLVVGEKEEQAKTINFRERGSEGKTVEMTLGELTKRLNKEIKEKKL
jgi:threonyl-tRNA synthetase